MDSLSALPFATALSATLPPLATLVLGALGATLAIRFSARRRGQQLTGRFAGRFEGAPEAAFVFSGNILHQASEAGHQLLRPRLEAQPNSTEFEALVAHLKERGYDLGASMERLIGEGVAFRCETPKDDGRIVVVEGKPQGAMSAVVIRDMTQSETRARDLGTALEQLAQERENFAMVLDTAPFSACQIAPDGQMSWHNDTYARLTTDLPANAERLSQTIRDAGQIGSARISLGVEDRTRWFDLLTRSAPDGSTLAFALPADRLVATEDALHRFVTTLTETFAHLSVGLAVFDESRRLHIFNPALSDLTGLKPSWLATRPSMQEVFDRLRERRIMPVQPNFEQFRAALARIEAEAAAGDLSETWILPTGRTFRISGRPHPKNAVALMVEDISDNVTLERQFRSEIKLGLSALDCVTEALAIFDLDGRMTFANRAFAGLWGLPPDWPDEGLTIQLLATHCSARTEASPFWGQLRDFATAGEDRKGWKANVRLLGGDAADHAMAAKVEPMPNGSTLVVFRRNSKDQERALPPALPHIDWTTDLYREALLEAADQLGAGSNLAEDMRITVEQADVARQLEAFSQKQPPASAISDLRDQLAALVSEEGHTLDLEIDSTLDAAHLPPSTRYAILGLLMAVKSLSKPKARLEVALLDETDATQVTVMTKAAKARAKPQATADTLPLRILARLNGSPAQIETFAVEGGGSGLSLRVPHAPESGTPPQLALGS